MIIHKKISTHGIITRRARQFDNALVCQLPRAGIIGIREGQGEEGSAGRMQRMKHGFARNHFQRISPADEADSRIGITLQDMKLTTAHFYPDRRLAPRLAFCKVHLAQKDHGIGNAACFCIDDRSIRIGFEPFFAAAVRC